MKKTKATRPATKNVASRIRMAASLPALSHKLDIWEIEMVRFELVLETNCLILSP